MTRLKVTAVVGTLLVVVAMAIAMSGFQAQRFLVGRVLAQGGVLRHTVLTRRPSRPSRLQRVHDGLQAKYGHWHGFDSQIASAFAAALTNQVVGN